MGRQGQGGGNGVGGSWVRGGGRATGMAAALRDSCYVTRAAQLATEPANRTGQCIIWVETAISYKLQDRNCNIVMITCDIADES